MVRVCVGRSDGGAGLCVVYEDTGARALVVGGGTSVVSTLVEGLELVDEFWWAAEYT
jgi:hypothetical protein